MIFYIFNTNFSIIQIIWNSFHSLIYAIESSKWRLQTFISHTDVIRIIVNSYTNSFCLLTYSQKCSTTNKWV